MKPFDGKGPLLRAEMNAWELHQKLHFQQSRRVLLEKEADYKRERENVSKAVSCELFPVLQAVNLVHRETISFTCSRFSQSTASPVKGSIVDTVEVLFLRPKRASTSQIRSY